ncbi:MAG: GerW family sporulation protein [Eubacteriales bacterium]|jgi:sporulation protein YtfJ
MSEAPIKGVMNTLFENIKGMVDANTVVGDMITTPDGVTILPVSKISVGFGSAGGEKGKKEATPPDGNLFSGGGGGGVSVTPLGFLVTSKGNIRFIPITPNVTSVDRLIDSVPGVIDKVNGIVHEYSNKKEEKQPVDEAASHE